MAEEKIEFEKSLKRLEEIVAKVEGETLPLEESLKLYEEGSKIVKLLNEELKKAEEKVEKVIEIEK